MHTAHDILYSAASALGRHGTLLLVVAITLVLLAVALAFVAVGTMTATTEGTLVAPLRWLSRA